MGASRYNCCYIAETDVELVYVNHATLSNLFNSCFMDVMQIVLKRFEKAQNARIGIPMPKRSSDEVDPEEYDSSDESEITEIINDSSNGLDENIASTATIIDETKPQEVMT